HQDKITAEYMQRFSNAVHGVQLFFAVATAFNDRVNYLYVPLIWRSKEFFRYFFSSQAYGRSLVETDHLRFRRFKHLSRRYAKDLANRDETRNGWAGEVTFHTCEEPFGKPRETSYLFNREPTLFANSA